MTIEGRTLDGSKQFEIGKRKMSRIKFSGNRTTYQLGEGGRRDLGIADAECRL